MVDHLRDKLGLVAMVKATSPDGRSWEINAVREPISFGNKSQPFFWASVVVTVILIAVTIVFAFLSTIFAVIAGIVLLIWLAERISNLLRPRLYARTKGPPPEEVVWKANRFARGKLEHRIVRAIEAGNPDVEPPGLTLLSD
jgi:hypothetical protein